MFARHEGLTETELKALVAAAETDSINMRAAIARNDAIRDMAKLRLIRIALEEDAE